jgi:peptide chain release factor 2
LRKRSRRCGGTFDVEGKRARLDTLESQREESGFWDDHDAATRVSQEIATLGSTLEAFDTARSAAEDLAALWELTQEEGQTEDERGMQEIAIEVQRIADLLELLEVESLLDGEYDDQPAVVTLRAGAGGVDSCDFAEMLFRMYSMWAPREDLALEITHEHRDDIAGVQSLTFRAVGRHPYGMFQVEKGTHRLVRISPFDNTRRRHTSFVGVDVVPELPERFEVELDEKDIKMDVFRASSAGGQHVNKTSTAVRLTHLPTGIIAACQNERSQHLNRQTALLQLKSKLVALMQELRKERIEDLRGAQVDIAWGNQIRSYVLHPYQLVKDLRTGHETAHAQRVLDGDLTPFIWAGLKWLREQKD